MAICFSQETISCVSMVHFRVIQTSSKYEEKKNHHGMDQATSVRNIEIYIFECIMKSLFCKHIGDNPTPNNLISIVDDTDLSWRDRTLRVFKFKIQYARCKIISLSAFHHSPFTIHHYFLILLSVSYLRSIGFHDFRN